MSAQPLISVIITSYNYRHFIARAIDSVRAQTYPNLEIVIVDNCSTDGTVAAIEEQYRADPRVRVFVNERNVGELENSNRGFAHSTGAFVLWLSADDWLLPHHIERLYAVFEREPQLDVVHSGAYFADAQERVHSLRRMAGQLPFDYVDARDEALDMFLTNCPLCWPTALFRRSVFIDVGPEDIDGPHASDWEMQIRIALAGKRFAYLSDPSTVLRMHGGQGTGKDYVTSGRNARDFIEILERFIDHPAIERIRGREGGVATFLDNFLEQTKLLAGSDPFSPEIYARAAALRNTLRSRAADYQPAKVREQRVSVIVSKAASPQLVARSIASVGAQTHPNWEIVFLDHGPFPLAELLRLGPFGERITCVRTPVAYDPGRARNLAMRLARGEYLAFVDAGDRFAPDHLATLAATIERTGASVAATGARCIIENADAAMADFTTLGEIRIYRTPSDPPPLGAVAPALPLGALLMYRHVLDRVGVFDEQLTALDDFDYVMRLEAHAPVAMAAPVTLDVHVNATLKGPIGDSLGSYVALLDRVFAANPASPTVGALRARHRAAVENAIKRVFTPPIGIAEITSLLATMAGRAVVPLAEP